MTNQKKNFLQETAFEEDVNPIHASDSYWRDDKSKRKLADKFSQWLQSDKK